MSPWSCSLVPAAGLDEDLQEDGAALVWLSALPRLRPEAGGVDLQPQPASLLSLDFAVEAAQVSVILHLQLRLSLASSETQTGSAR